MRRVPFLLLSLILSSPALAQTEDSADSPVSDKPPELILLDDSVAPEIHIRQRDGDTIEEYRLNGHLYKIRVIPQRGEPYILFNRGDGTFLPEMPGTPSLSVPQWVIGTF